MLALLASGDSAALLIQFLVMAAIGGICAAVAHGRGRSAVGWFFLGAFFPCIALILVFVLPDLKREAAQRESQERTNRRLREQLAKERQVADARHAQTERRLAAHDQALLLDTETTDAEPPRGLPPPLPLERTWHYAVGASSHGPVTLDELRRLIESGTLKSDSLVWRDGMAVWQPVAETPELAEDES
ncbi:MAG: DUF4339 domain-containing protein [Planctomycetota bacterium]